MKTPSSSFLITGALAVLLLSGCASQAYVQQPPAQFERGVLLQRVDTVMAGAQYSGSVRLAASPDPVVTGQTLQLEVATTQPGHLYLYQVATDGRTLSLVFPNAIDGANYLAAGSHRLPRANWQLAARGPAGTGYLMAVLTPQALNVVAMQADAQQGNINLPAPYSAALATLREVAAR
jgi:hypothetical protein